MRHLACFLLDAECLQTLSTASPVAAALGQENGMEVQSFTQNYPKKVFDQMEFGASLKELGLVPSASLIVK